MQQDSKAGIKKNIETMLYNSGYISWDFTNIWTINEGSTIAYLRNTDKPDSVNKENITYQAFDIQGKGTSLNPYIITTPVQLQKVNENLEAYYKLGADIDLTGVNWTPIGTDKSPFKGKIDGNGYTISNLTMTNNLNNVGLFGYNLGIIKNIKVSNFNVTANNYAGTLLGYNLGTVTGCKINSSSITGASYIGGLVGYNNGSIDTSTTSGSVAGTSYVGGLVGYTIANITGNISSSTVSGTDSIGGLIGYVYANNINITIDNSGANRKCNRSNKCRWINWFRIYISYICSR